MKKIETLLVKYHQKIFEEVKDNCDDLLLADIKLK